jgi:hypothetical protein
VNCPLCGTLLRRSQPDPDFGVVMEACDGNEDPGHTEDNPYCELAGTWLTPEAWRRLTSPALPPTVTAVLEAAVAWSTVPTDEDHAESVALEDAIYDWGETGRPGLPRAATTKATTMRCPTHGSIVCRCDQEGR